MHERNVVIRESGSGIATGSLVAIIVIAALVALFVWQPWDSTTSRMPSSTTTQGTSASNASGDTNAAH